MSSDLKVYCCCCKNLMYKLDLLKNDTVILKEENKCLENKLRSTNLKQQDAKRKCLLLVEQNKFLENEMKALDEIALKVEEESNYNSLTNKIKLKEMADEFNEAEIKIKNLQCENTRLKQKNNELVEELDVIKTEKDYFKQLLENTIKTMDIEKGSKEISDSTVDSLDKITKSVSHKKKKYSNTRDTVDKKSIKSSSQKSKSARKNIGRSKKNAKAQKRASTDANLNEPETASSPNLEETRSKKNKNRKYKSKIPLNRESKTLTATSSLQNQVAVKSKSNTKRPHSTESEAIKSRANKKTRKRSLKKSSTPSKKATSVEEDTEKITNKLNSSPKIDNDVGLKGVCFVEVKTKDDCRCCCTSGGCVSEMKELLEKDMKISKDYLEEINALRRDKEYYMKEYQKLLGKYCES